LRALNGVLPAPPLLRYRSRDLLKSETFRVETLRLNQRWVLWESGAVSRADARAAAVEEEDVARAAAGAAATDVAETSNRTLAVPEALADDGPAKKLG
jgi:hypothetical protein